MKKSGRLPVIVSVLLAAAILFSLSGCSDSGGPHSGTDQHTRIPSEIHTDLPTDKHTDIPADNNTEPAVTETVTTYIPAAETDIPSVTDTPASGDENTPVVEETKTPTSAPSDPTPTSTPSPKPSPTDDPYEVNIDGTPEPTEFHPTEEPATPEPTPTAPPVTEKPTEAPTPGEDYVGLAGKKYSEYKYLKSAGDLFKIDEVIRSVTTDEMDIPEKIRQIHEWMVKNIAYDTSLRSRHIDSLLATGKSVCQGYAELFYVFMGELQVPCEFISGTAGGESHAWNAVKLDGKWYYVDVTWDDPLVGGHSDYPDGSNLRYTYFLVTKAVISSDHTPEGFLPEPAGTSDSYHDNAVEKAQNELLDKLNGMIKSGEVVNGFIMNGPDDIDATIARVIESIGRSAEAGIAPYKFTIYFISGTGDPKELSQTILQQLSEAAVNAYKKSVRCSMKIQEQDFYGTMAGEITVGE